MNAQNPLIEPMDRSASNNDMNNLHMKQDFLPTNINHNLSSSTTTTATSNNNNFNSNYTQPPPTQQRQQQHQQTNDYPLIAPFQHSIYPNYELSRRLPYAKKVMATATPASEITSASATTTTQPSMSLPNAQIIAASNNGNTTETTTKATTDDLQTPKPSSEQPQTVIPKPKVKITGDNVSSANIEEGYIQFVLEHDATYISDGIDSLVYAKRKFQSVPKTGDISYTTWDIYQLVLKLHKQEVCKHVLESRETYSWFCLIDQELVTISGSIRSS